MYINSPAHNSQIEKQIIGAILISPESADLAFQKLSEEDFFSIPNLTLFATLKDFFSKGVELDRVLLKNALEAAGNLKKVGGERYLTEIFEEVYTDAHLSKHITAIKELTFRRKLVSVLSAQLEAALNLETPAKELMDSVEESILTLNDQSRTGPQLKSAREILKEASQEWWEVAAGKPNGISSSIKPLDSLIGGFRAGKVYVLGAKPGVGKSMLALQVAVKSDVPVAHFSLEMLAMEQMERMVSQEMDMSSDDLRDPKMLMNNKAEIIKTVEKLSASKVRFCDEGPLTTLQIFGLCRRMKNKFGLGLIVVDYIQLLKGVGKFERRDLEIGTISKSLKQIAMKLQVPIIIIASLSRKPDERSDKRPIMSDLRESGSIESDADCVMFLYRESEFNKTAFEKFPNVTEIIISKNRSGKRGKTIVNFDGAHSMFYALEQSNANEYLTLIGEKQNANNEKKHDPRTGGIARKVQNTNNDGWGS